MSRRRTGAVAIGVGALTAVVLSLAGAKTPVVIGSSAALGIAGGVAAGRKSAGKRVLTIKQLVGEELLVKVKELRDVSKSDLVRACGYVSNKNDGRERIHFTAFYEALLEAKRVQLFSEKSKLEVQQDISKQLDQQQPKQLAAEDYKNRGDAMEETGDFDGGNKKIFASQDELGSVFYHLPPGKYFVGDLGYVKNSKEDWIEFFYNPSMKDGDGVYSYKGKEFMIWSTGGDGFFPYLGGIQWMKGLKGRIMVDSGSIGAIPVDLIDDQEKMISLCDANHGFILDCKDGLSVALVVEDGEDVPPIRGTVYQVEFYDMSEEQSESEEDEYSHLYDEGNFVYLHVNDTHEQWVANEKK